jgi:hypothetical protein
MAKEIAVWSNVNLQMLPKQTAEISEYRLRTEGLHSLPGKFASAHERVIPDAIWIHADLNYPGLLPSRTGNWWNSIASTSQSFV